MFFVCVIFIWWKSRRLCNSFEHSNSFLMRLENLPGFKDNIKYIFPIWLLLSQYTHIVILTFIRRRPNVLDMFYGRWNNVVYELSSNIFLLTDGVECSFPSFPRDTRGRRLSVGCNRRSCGWPDPWWTWNGGVYIISGLTMKYITNAGELSLLVPANKWQMLLVN